ncbi:unnamed protein product [Adineta ricciae]|uniref:Uncharacterized protein n=1 Tax=Adineta ricciae TaxID=249248 RepID=A0A815UBE6_ADIRI|nr:unnamed protein product [Adineta ricciae]
MESLIKKSLNKREKSFEKSSCPLWLLNILPTPFKTIEIINENENENDQQQQIFDDLKPYELIQRIPLLNQFDNELLNNSLQLLYLSSNKQIVNLIKTFQEHKQMKLKKINEENRRKQCEESLCLNFSIPLSSFCKEHFLEKDLKQILFVQCSICQKIKIKFDEKNLFNFCSH